MIATEEPVLALGAATLLSAAGGFEVTRTPATYAQLERLAAQEAPDLILIDAASAITPALFALARRASPRSRIVLWARSITDELSDQARIYEVAGFASRTAANNQLVDQLRRIAHGATEFDCALSSAARTEVRLSPRESQIVSLLSQGLKNKEIASCLELSEGTVKSYLVHLFRKVGARDRLELAILALRNTHCGEAFWDGPALS